MIGGTANMARRDHSHPSTDVDARCRAAVNVEELMFAATGKSSLPTSRKGHPRTTTFGKALDGSFAAFRR
jgi:hypothetical protein